MLIERLVYWIVDKILDNFYLVMGIIAALFIIILILGWR
jgi:hypothetical protein